MEMTKQEAIECLRNKKHCADCKYYEVASDNMVDLTCWDVAHEMAIQALENEAMNVLCAEMRGEE